MKHTKKRVRYTGPSEGISLTHNKIYEALGFESGFIRVIDDTDEDYLYEPDNFVIIEDEKESSSECFF